MSLFTIRRAKVSDAPALAELAAGTFTETFAKDNTPEDLEVHLKSAFGVPQQTAEIQDPEVVTLLGFKETALIGFAQVRRSSAPSCVVAERPIELHRLYVASAVHGSGVARILMEHAHRVASEFGGSHLWLGVWERNPRAIAFYRKMGFNEVGSHTFLVGTDPQRDLVFAKPLASAVGAPATD